jgi:hypothetical protein
MARAKVAALTTLALALSIAAPAHASIDEASIKALIEKAQALDPSITVETLTARTRAFDPGAVRPNDEAAEEQKKYDIDQAAYLAAAAIYQKLREEQVIYQKPREEQTAAPAHASIDEAHIKALIEKVHALDPSITAKTPLREPVPLILPLLDQVMVVNLLRVGA